MYQGYHTLFSVFTITPSKIKIETIQYRKSRIWEMKGDKYAKGLAKNQVGAVFHMKETRENVLQKCIRLCMETPRWCPFEGAFIIPSLNSLLPTNLSKQIISV